MLESGFDRAYFGLMTNQDGGWKTCTEEPVTFTNWSLSPAEHEYKSRDYGMLSTELSDATWLAGDFSDIHEEELAEISGTITDASEEAYIDEEVTRITYDRAYVISAIKACVLYPQNEALYHNENFIPATLDLDFFNGIREKHALENCPEEQSVLLNRAISTDEVLVRNNADEASIEYSFLANTSAVGFICEWDENIPLIN